MRAEYGKLSTNVPETVNDDYDDDNEHYYYLNPLFEQTEISFSREAGVQKSHTQTDTDSHTMKRHIIRDYK